MTQAYLLRRISTKLAATALTFVAVSFVQPVFAQESAGTIPKISDLTTVIGNVVKLLAPIAAVAFLAMMLFGGFKYLTAGGDPKAAASARSTLTYAFIGVILVVISWLLLQMIGQITGKPDITTVTIPEP